MAMTKRNTVVLDIETMEAVMPRGSSSVFQNISGGIHPDEMMIFAGGRQTGKSTMTYQMLKSRYYEMGIKEQIQKLDTFALAGATWYTVHCRPSTISGWVQEQDPDMWCRHYNTGALRFGHPTFNNYNIHEELYSMLLLKWS
jgi:hypothetical protein